MSEQSGRDVRRQTRSGTTTTAAAARGVNLRHLRQTGDYRNPWNADSGCGCGNGRRKKRNTYDESGAKKRTATIRGSWENAGGGGRASLVIKWRASAYGTAQGEPYLTCPPSVL